MTLTLEKEFILTSKERETIYTFLKTVLEQPLAKETLINWRNNLSPDFLDILTDENENLRHFFTELNSKSVEEIYLKEKEAYLATFDLINKKGKIPAPPWESVYVTKDQTLFGEPVLQIRQKLKEFGLTFVKENREPEDHISIELEFMAFLIHYTSESMEENNKTNYTKGVYNQYWLLKEHLTKWVEPFAQDINSSSTTRFYKGIAELLCLFISEDYGYIKSLKEELDNE